MYVYIYIYVYLSLYIYIYIHTHYITTRSRCLAFVAIAISGSIVVMIIVINTTNTIYVLQVYIYIYIYIYISRHRLRVVRVLGRRAPRAARDRREEGPARPPCMFTRWFCRLRREETISQNRPKGQNMATMRMMCASMVLHICMPHFTE